MNNFKTVLKLKTLLSPSLYDIFLTGKKAGAGNCHSSYHNMKMPFKGTWSYKWKTVFWSHSLLVWYHWLPRLWLWNRARKTTTDNLGDAISFFDRMMSYFIDQVGNLCLYLSHSGRTNVRVSCRGTALELVRTLQHGGCLPAQGFKPGRSSWGTVSLTTWSFWPHPTD